MTRAKSSDLPDHLEFAHRLADISGEVVLPYFRKSIAVRNKADATGFDPVTAADRAAERAIRKAITARYPEHGIVGEEFAQVAGAGHLNWVIDPIDGTRAFITGMPLWGTLIGLLDAGEPVLGLMNQPFTGERFWGAGGKAHSSIRGTAPRARLKTRACAVLGRRRADHDAPRYVLRRRANWPPSSGSRRGAHDPLWRGLLRLLPAGRRASST